MASPVRARACVFCSECGLMVTAGKVVGGKTAPYRFVNLNDTYTSNVGNDRFSHPITLRVRTVRGWPPLRFGQRSMSSPYAAQQGSAGWVSQHASKAMLQLGGAAEPTCCAPTPCLSRSFAQTPTMQGARCC